MGKVWEFGKVRQVQLDRKLSTEGRRPVANLTPSDGRTQMDDRYRERSCYS
ncbi:MAG: hypothetical protein GDA48_24535 [Hormoscilla sp. GM102CHS1]|nr:hypothetical protein [Hormoscilla sp. GM102CHS1]